MITTINEFKLYLENFRFPDDVELDMAVDYENIDFREIDIENLEGDGSDIAYLGIHLPGEDYLNKGIVVDIKIVNEVLYLINILLDMNLQGMGLGYKIYKKFIYEFGHVYSSFAKRVNDAQVVSIWKKLKNESVFETHTSATGEISILKSLPQEDKNTLLKAFNDI